MALLHLSPKLPRSREELVSRVGVPMPTTEAEAAAVLSQGISLLRSSSKSGFQYVLPTASPALPWQAKPYIRPGVQRDLGSFPTKEGAAEAVLLWLIGVKPTPPTPPRGRNKRGEGKRPRDRRKPGAPCLPHSYPSLTVPCSRRR